MARSGLNSTLFVEGENRKLWEEVNYDTHPLYSKVRWDWHYAAGDWSEQVTWWDKSGQPVLQEQKWLNDGGSVDHGKVWQWDSHGHRHLAALRVLLHVR